MTRVVRGGPQQGLPGEIVVSVGHGSDASGASIAVMLDDEGASRALADRLHEALSRLEGEPPSPPCVWVDGATEPDEAPRGLAGQLVIVRLRARAARALEALVGAIERAGAAGVQLSWPSTAALPVRLERAVFSVLEARRGARGAAPVVLSGCEAPCEALRWLVKERASR